MKITMYELLGMVKDGKAPKKIEYDGLIWTFNKNFNQYQTRKGGANIWNGYNFNILNFEVEILEEEKKIPEKLETYKDKNNTIFLNDLCYKYRPIHKDSLSFNEQVTVDKLNNVIDYLKSKGE